MSLIVNLIRLGWTIVEQKLTKIVLRDKNKQNIIISFYFGISEVNGVIRKNNIIMSQKI